MRSLANDLSRWVIGGICLIGFPLFGYTYRTIYILMRSAILDQAEAAVTLAQVELDDWLSEVAESTAVLASGLNVESPDPYAINTTLQRFVLRSSSLYGVTLATPPLYRVDPAQQFFAPLYYRIPSLGLQFADLSEPRYSYLSQAWYEQTRFSGQSQWLEPYFDAHGGGIQVITYTVPIHFYEQVEERRRRQLFGVVATHISLRDIQGEVSDLTINEKGYGLIFSQQTRQFVAHPEYRLTLQGNLETLSRRLNRPELATQEAVLTDAEAGIYHYTESGNRYWLAIAPLETLNWSLALLLSDRELTQDINTIFIQIIFFGLLGLIAVSTTIAILLQHLIRPLESLSKAATTIAAGQLDTPIPVTNRRDEIGQLTSQFQSMQTSLQAQILDLERVTAAKQKLESELEIAHSIQVGMLPSTLDLIYETHFVLSCSLVSARQIGGDLFDFFVFGERLFFCVGDVSGKGIPAALFMARTITLVRAIAVQENSPDVILQRVNQELSRNNPELLFVTVFFGVLDVVTGILSAANAGHEMPFMIVPHTSVTLTNVETGTPLGIDDDSQYPLWQTQLDPGQMLLLYSDGLTEARNTNDEEFSLYRVETVLERFRCCPPIQTLRALQFAVAEFCGETEPWDDITLLCLKFGHTHILESQPMNVSWQVEVNSQPISLDAVVPTILEALNQANLPGSVLEDVQLIIEELITNIVKYAFPSEQTKRYVTINYDRIEPCILSLQFQDNGVAFNPLKNIPDPEEFDEDDRPIGGLGLYLVQQLSQDVIYNRIKNQNILTLNVLIPLVS